MGITDFAQSSLGDVVYVQLPEADTQVTAGETFGEVESTKSVSDLYAPVSATVVGVNAALQDSPQLINSDPYGQGWLLELRADPDALEQGWAGCWTPTPIETPWTDNAVFWAALGLLLGGSADFCCYGSFDNGLSCRGGIRRRPPDGTVECNDGGVTGDGHGPAIGGRRDL